MTQSVYTNIAPFEGGFKIDLTPALPGGYTTEISQYELMRNNIRADKVKSAKCSLAANEVITAISEIDVFTTQGSTDGVTVIQPFIIGQGGLKISANYTGKTITLLCFYDAKSSLHYSHV